MFKDDPFFFLMIPSYFKIEILAIQDEFVLLGHKGLTLPYLEQRVGMFEEPAAHGVPRLVVGHGVLLGGLQHVGLLLHARHHPLDGRLEVLHHNRSLGLPCCDQRCFVANIADVSTCNGDSFSTFEVNY